jgi:hypothetical protein
MEISAALLFEGNIESLDFALAGACSQHDTAAQRHLLWRSQCCQPAFDLRLVMERNGKPLADLTTDCNAVSSMRVMAATEIIVCTSIEFDAVYLGSRALPRSGHSRRSLYLAQGRGKNLSKGRWKKSVCGHGSDNHGFVARPAWTRLQKEAYLHRHCPRRCGTQLR